jgi:preprotein translocase subunit YajC
MFISSVYAADTAVTPSNSSSPISTIVMMLIFGVVFYFLLIRPQSKKQKEHKAMMNNIQTGDEVVTNGGILGKVSKVTDQFVVLNVAQGVEMKFQKQSITATLPKGTIKEINR